MRSIVLLIVLSLCLSNVDARKSLKNNNVKSVQPPISNCYLAATSSIYLGCQATATDLLSTASVILGGSVHVSGNVMARSVTIGSCSEIDGDVISHGKVREGSNVFVKGVTLENWPWNDWEVVGATTSIPAKPSSYPTSTSQLVIVDQQDLELEDQDTFGLILVRAGGNLVLPEGTIFVANLIIEDGATITGTDDSTVWISNTLNIGSDVVVENYVKFISQQDIVIGKRLCGPAQNVEKRSEMRKERIGRLEASSCPCEVLEVEQSCYCDTVANIDLFAYGTLNIGTDSGVSGAILANNLIAGSGLCATCTASPFKPTYKMETRPTPSPAPPASSGQASSITPS